MKWHLSHYIVPFELLCLEFFFRWLSLPHSNYKTCQTFSNNSEQLQHVEISLCNFSLQMNFHEHLKIVHKQKRNCCFHMCTSTVNVYMNTHLCPEMNAGKKKKKADLTEFHQNEQIFTDLTILTNFCHFC